MSNINQMAAAAGKYINSANETIFPFEQFTDGMEVIATDHAYIHQGLLYQISITAALSAGGVYNLGLTTPATGYIHYRPARATSSGDKVLIELYEGNSITGGATGTAINHSRTTTSASTMTITTSASVTSAGTRLDADYIGGGTGVGGSRQGDRASGENEFVLEQSTNYNQKFTNNSSASNSIVFTVIWYEEGKG